MKYTEQCLTLQGSVSPELSKVVNLMCLVPNELGRVSYPLQSIGDR